MATVAVIVVTAMSMIIMTVAVMAMIAMAVVILDFIVCKTDQTIEHAGELAGPSCEHDDDQADDIDQLADEV